MSTRKKAPKKSSSRSAKAIKRSPKSSATSKSRDAKVSAKISKPARSTKKLAAKATKTAKVSSRKPAAKTKAARPKSSRVAAAAKSSARTPAKTTKKKSVSAPKLQRSKGAAKAHVRSTESQSKERVIVSAVKKKSENEKKGQERLSATVHAKTVQHKTPAAPSKTPVAGDRRGHPGEPPKVVNPPAAVIGLEAAATLRPAKAPPIEKPAVADTEEAVAQKPAKSSGPRHGFKTNEFIVYPAHGVGQIVALEEQEVAGFKLELFVITFVKDKMTLRVPTGKVAGVGMRKLAEPEVVKKALDILLGRARIKRTMWSRRAQEYETKINSGDLAAISEVVRDLYRSEAQPEQSYSERQLYEAALDRMAREVAVVQKLTESEALKAIDAQLQKGQRRGAKIESDAATPGGGDSDVEEAA